MISLVSNEASEVRSMNVVGVTGGDSRFFLHLLLLLASFRRTSPGRRLHICDFGLTEPQIAYLRRHAEVHAMPAQLRNVAHTWYRKGSLDLYLQDVAFDAMVWIDADCMMLSDLVGELTEIAASRQASVLACREFDSFAAVIAENMAAGRDSIRLFADIIAHHGLSADLPYVNIGLFYCDSRPLLQEWRERTLQTPPHPLFEQNVFNALCHQRGVLREVDAAVFNVTGARLNALAAGEGGTVTEPQGRHVRLAHLTSSVDGVLDVLEMSIHMGGLVLRGMMRRPHNPVLRAVQLSLIEEIGRDAAGLAECGLLATG